MSANAECTWGDGPDVLVVVLRSAGWMTHEGNKNEAGSFGLDREGARSLARQLLRAAARADELEETFEAHASRS